MLVGVKFSISNQHTWSNFLFDLSDTLFPVINWKRTGLRQALIEMAEFPSPFTALLSKLSSSDSTIVTIRCDGGDVTAKKSLLTTVSDVFKRMFENDFLEKETNTVMANDVPFMTMEFIIQCYTGGTVLCFQEVDKDAFEYIVEKYNFLGIQEEAAEKVIHIYRETGDIEALRNVFSIYKSQKSKMTALKELIPIVAAGQKAPCFVDLFTIEEFKEFSKICCDVLKDSKVEQWDGFLKTFHSWTLKNPEVRFIASLEILGMINTQQFPVAEVLTLLENMKLGDTFQIIKSILEKLLRYMLKVEIEKSESEKSDPLPIKSNPGKMSTIKSSKIHCRACGHNDELPYHIHQISSNSFLPYSSKSMGKHLEMYEGEIPTRRTNRTNSATWKIQSLLMDD
ncbi:uncharacterized protein LOC136030273 [Artemia franciscana]|uniref:uncharacterized protein LOC136030273 n=1 Tax=Artemia franciscana TaxID=6661 RepID=UPI0032DAC142